MKYVLVLLLACPFATTLHAQNGLYLAPSIGAGLSNANRSVLTGSGEMTMGNAKGPVFSQTAQLGIGYQYKHWRFQSGIQYFQGGYKTDDPIFRPATDNPAMPVSLKDEYRFVVHQVGIPLQVGYAIALSPRLTLVPYAGITTAFAFAGNARLSNGAGTTGGGLEGIAVNDYGRFTLWGQAGLQLEYKLNNRISLTGGPSVQYRLAGTGNRDAKNYYNLNFNLGAKINLGKARK
ncbi:outer membrane beta-barrel protein [Taibaiella koreensis]|uniref:outer membrane beta-barrel protein n=1 Tax=Taibaiella koreensis TaxID=1268548 RepID=UPI000E5A03AF|nr:outer membrane beta-barrel protein [Taibaiella koreensis]